MTPSVWAQNEFDARVVTVSDGDSIRVIDGNGQRHTIRVADIDAPELQQANGIACRDALRRQLQQQTVRIRVLEHDQYDRKVARLWLYHQDVGLNAIERGCAWHYRSVARSRGDAGTFNQYAQAENQAKNARLGLWQTGNPTPPWRFRRENRRSQP